MRKALKSPQVVTIVWHSDFIDSIRTTDLVHSNSKEKIARTTHREKKIPVSFRDTILPAGKPLAIHLNEPD